MVKTALWDAPVEWILAAFETRPLMKPGTRPLAFVTLGGRFAVTGSDASADSLWSLMMRTFCFHFRYLPVLRVHFFQSDLPGRQALLLKH